MGFYPAAMGQNTHITQHIRPRSNKTQHTKLHKQQRAQYTQWIQHTIRKKRKKGKVKLSLKESLRAYRAVRCWFGKERKVSSAASYGSRPTDIFIYGWETRPMTALVSGCIDPRFLTSALVPGYGQLHAPVALPPGARAPPHIHRIAGWAGPRAGLHDMGNWQCLALPRLELRLLGRPDRSQSLCRPQIKSNVRR
jgi:hypothetical protein